MQPSVLFSFAVTAAFCVGCGAGGPEVADVTGTVTLDGNPVPGAAVTFHPEAAGGSPSYGVTDDQGKYKMMFTMDRSGAMLGKNWVEIEVPKLSKSEIEEMKANGQTPPPRLQIPKKYKEQGALTAEVKSGANDIPFALTSK